MSRYGAISRVMPELAPGAKLFLVSDSDDTTVGPLNLGAEFPVDKDGVVRVYTTIQAAINACASNRGDVVLALPGYNQTITGDSWNVAGVTVLGMGRGTMRPTLTYAVATATVDVGASNVRISGMRFLAAADSIARAVDADTAFVGLQFDNNIFDFDTLTNDFRVMLRLGQRRSVIENNRFLAQDTAGSGSGIRLKGGDASYATIRNNFFYGQFDTVGDTSDGGAAIAIDTADTADTNLSGFLIQNNVIVSTDTAVGAAIRLLGGGYKVRGILDGNKIGSYDCAGADSTIFSAGGAATTANRLYRFDTVEKLMNDSGVLGA